MYYLTLHEYIGMQLISASKLGYQSRVINERSWFTLELFLFFYSLTGILLFFLMYTTCQALEHLEFSELLGLFQQLKVNLAIADCMV